MNKIQKKVLKVIRDHSLFVQGDTVVVAVSGGADSVALFDLLMNFQEYRLNLVIAHLNHQLRGEESDRDEEFVRRLAADYGVPCEVASVDVKALSLRERLSLEDAGRRARYEFFRKVSLCHGAQSVALAHHADDQAETVIMRLLRGAGITGLSAMTPRSSGGYVRPLLSLRREEIETYIREKEIIFREDQTNFDTNFLRNRVRHELIPYLAGFNPGISERLAVTAEILAADEELLESIAADSLPLLVHEASPESIALDTVAIREKMKGLRYRLYRLVIARLSGGLVGITFRHLQQIDDLVRSPRPNLKFVIPGCIAVVKCYGIVRFSLTIEDQTDDGEFFIEGPGCYPIPGGGEVVVEVSTVPEGWETVPATKVYFDAEKVPFPWLVRGFRPGDRISPLGMTGTKKVKNLFIDEKVPVGLRRRIPVVVSGGDIVWVCGYRTAGKGRITNGTTRVIVAEVKGRPLK